MRIETILLDVRSYEEFKDGVIEGAMLIPIDELAERFAEIPTGAHVVAYCASGVRSESARQFLETKGFLVSNGGGIEDLSKELKLSIVKPYL
jgi:phage shock protein E